MSDEEVEKVDDDVVMANPFCNNSDLDNNLDVEYFDFDFIDGERITKILNY